MDAPVPVWQRSSYGALPLILTDTSALMELAKIEIVQDTKMGSSETRANIARAVIDNLVGNENRTMVLTRRNFIELFHTISGSLDLEQTEDGQVRIPEGVSYTEMRFPDENIMYQIFQDYQRDGKLRCYESMDAMLEAGEVAPPKGGIVIVDVLGRGDYPTNGRLNNRKQSPGAVIDNDAKKTRAAQKPDAGDDRLLALGERILTHTRENGLNPKFMVFNNDSGLGRRFEMLARKEIDGGRGKQPSRARVLDMVAALFQGNQEQVAGCDITGDELSRFAQAMSSERAQAGKLMPQASNVEREAGYIKDWLELTSGRGVNSWAGRTAVRQDYGVA